MEVVPVFVTISPAIFWETVHLNLKTPNFRRGSARRLGRENSERISDVSFNKTQRSNQFTFMATFLMFQIYFLNFESFLTKTYQSSHLKSNFVP